MDPQTPSPPGAPFPSPSSAPSPFPAAGPAPAPSFPPPPKSATPGPSFPPPGDIKFPAKPGGIKPLVLPRRPSPLQRAQEASQATAEARKSINTIMSQSRPPWGGTPTLSGSQVESLEKALRSLEAKAAERDRALAETEALLQAREKVIDAMRKEKPAQGGGTGSSEEIAALTKLKEELDRQEASIKEQRAAQQEREDFLNASETSLFEKMQAQQEKETELEQKAEDLKKGMIKAGMIKPEAKEKA